ncbi:MAG: beta-ketoacyl synthase chain length factor [Methylococcales bacterium]
MDSINIQSIAACSTEDDLGRILGFDVSALDTSMIPPALRRRSSLPCKLAINAAMSACKTAGVEASATPTLFASVGGEMVITDQLCLELTRPTVHISPTQFHNSVHNTAAAYWSIVTGCQQASSAMAAGEQTIAMALVEAWGQLATQGGDLLLVCYEECWPDYVDPGMGHHAIAFAMLLSTEASDHTIAQFLRPRVVDQPPVVEAQLAQLIDGVPLFALTPLFQALTGQNSDQVIPVSFQSQYWVVDCMLEKQSKQGMR